MVRRFLCCSALIVSSKNNGPPFDFETLRTTHRGFSSTAYRFLSLHSGRVDCLCNDSSGTTLRREGRNCDCCVTRAIMEAARTSETSVNFYQATWRNNPEDCHLHGTVLFSYKILTCLFDIYLESISWFSQRCIFSVR
jgi:hypothetical protein